MHLKSWDDVLACRCDSCRALAEIYLCCQGTEEFLFVCDCRMFGQGFRVADARKLFHEPATEGPAYPDYLQAATDHVLKAQHHCDAFVSSWPLVPAGKPDFLWARVQVATPFVTNP